MIPADLPDDERRRLGDLCALGVLDSPADPAFDRITRLAQRLFRVQVSLVSFVDADRLWFKSRQGLDALETSRETTFCAHAIHSNDIFVVENACDDPRFLGNPLVTGPPSIRFYAGAPVHSPNGRRLGTLCVIDDKPRQPTAEELDTLRDLAAIVDQEIAQLAMGVTDSVTGLHNRRGFATAANQILAVATRTNAPVVLAYTDLDGLKQINDRHGHATGDKLLAAASRILRSTFRDADIVARMGGDEFAALLYNATQTSAATIERRLHSAIDSFNRAGASPHELSMSVGCVERIGGEPLAELMARADAAMYTKKRQAQLGDLAVSTTTW